MAENVIFEDQTLDGFAAPSEGAPFFLYVQEGQLFSFVLGETYIVNWDGVEYSVIGTEVTDGGVTLVCIGNESFITGGNDTDEPFFIYAIEDISYIATDDTTTDTHTVAIYQVAEEVGIITRDRDFNETEHYGIETVTFDTTDGGTQVFSKGQAVEGVEIALDFSGGEDMTVNAADGTLIKSAVIKKPADLVPEKIAKGEKIAGIEGTDEPVLETLEVKENGTFTPSEGVDGFSIVTVDVKSPNICFIGTDAPDPAIGNDGDLYIVKG